MAKPDGLVWVGTTEEEVGFDEAPSVEGRQAILGQVRGKRGVIVATGAGRKGIHFGPVMGRIAADLVAHGNTMSDIAALAPGRSISAAQVASSDSDPFRF